MYSFIRDAAKLPIRRPKIRRNIWHSEALQRGENTKKESCYPSEQVNQRCSWQQLGCKSSAYTLCMCTREIRGLIIVNCNGHIKLSAKLQIALSLNRL